NPRTARLNDDRATFRNQTENKTQRRASRPDSGCRVDRSGLGARAAAALAESAGIFSGGRGIGDSWLRIARRNFFVAFGRHVWIARIYRRRRLRNFLFRGPNARRRRPGRRASRRRLWDQVYRRRGNRKFTGSAGRLWHGER